MNSKDILGVIFDTVFENKYQYDKDIALNDEHSVNTGKDIVTEINDMKRTIENYKGILLIIICISLMFVIFK